ncbi:MAG TPA: hypothetical protein VM386_05500 [Acidimicrobiales bacterium]|nr:hypothetical protein [Acidimicrobiales bacterium]
MVEDIVLHDLGRGWPFGTLSVAELSERAALAREFATRLYVSRGLGHEGIGLRMVDLLAWARALDDEVRQRADDCDQVDVLLADAIIGAGALIGAVESLQSSS